MILLFLYGNQLWFVLTNSKKLPWILEKLKAVHIIVGKEGKIQVQRKLTQIGTETRKLIDVFEMEDGGKLPEVDL